jgi:hypothetical protein
MNKLLGIDIDTIIKKVLNETLGKEQEMQDKKSEEMKDFKAPPDSKKKKDSDDTDEDDNPVSTEQELDKSVKASDIVDLLGRMRSGQSLKDEKVRKDFQGYFDSMGGAERLALKAYMVAITDIVAGESTGTEPEPTPDDYGVDMDVEDKKPKKKIKKKSGASKAKQADTGSDSAPIVVGESANKKMEMKILRGLK